MKRQTVVHKNYIDNKHIEKNANEMKMKKGTRNV